ncbi:hypothetical protein M8J77_018014 [Diaphorina citri]|nr:hypothetical protein M8J77_018014 [Diaphorina citri]
MWKTILHTTCVVSFFLLEVSGGYIEPGPKYRCPKTILNDHICSCLSSNDIGLNIVCKNTNLATLSVSLADISASQAPIEKLHLNHCNISRLYGDLFYSLDIKSLTLKNIPLMSIDDEIFLGINETLHELVVSNSLLESIPVGAFKILGNLKRLVLDTHNIAEIQDNTFQSGTWSRNIERLAITNGKVGQISNTVFTPLKKLKHLDLHGNNITELKKNQFKGMKNIDFLDLSFNAIKKIDGSHIGDMSNLGWLNISHNAIEDLGRSIFARNNLLKVLNLSFNRVKKIDVNTFRGMRLIRRLFLNNNNIGDVGRSTFSTMTRIGTIDLSYNFIKKIDYQMFFELNYVEKIDVSHNNVTEIEKFAFKDLYHVDILLSHNQINKIHTNAFINCANITMLDMSHNNIETFSKNAFDQQTFPLHFQLAYNKLKDTQHVPLSNMTGLKIFNVSYNEIVQMSRNTFPKLYELHTIDASHNQIAHISNAVMQPLLSLRFLNFTHNVLQEIKSETFGTLPTVLDLKLDYNQLDQISRGAFTKLSSLSTLSLTHNKINSMFELPISLGHLDLSYNSFETLPNSDVWPSMNALLSLNLANNMIGDTLSKGSFYPLLTLQSLDLSDNKLTVVPYEALSDFTSLRNLVMRSNQIQRLSKAAFGSLPVVFDLDISRNEISNISVKAFEGLLQLINLNLSYNKIEVIPNGAFQGLVALNTLDLSYNGLESLDNKTNSLFEDCLSLKNLFLSHNKISFLTKKSIPFNQYYKYKLEHIDLSYNSIPVLSFDFTFGTKDIKLFNLSHNQINEVRRYVIGNFTYLHILDLSYNEISNLHEPHVFKLPSNLTKLDLSNNLLSSVPVKEILNTTQLEELNLEHNKFTQIPTQLYAMLNKTKLRFAQNPLICDCYILPLYKWLHDQLKPDRDWLNTECILPKQIPIYNISLDEDLNVEYCSEFKGTLHNVNFRTINKINKNKDLYINWYVNNPRADIGDVQLSIRQNDSLLLKRQEHYNSRYEVIKLNKLNLASVGDRMVEVCLVSVNSKGESHGDEHCMRVSKAGRVTCGYALVMGVITTMSYWLGR